MNKITATRVPSVRSVIEPLEGRTLYSATLAPAAVAKVRVAATKTTLTATAGTVGQPVTFDVTVRAAVAAGSPAGTVTVLDHGTAIATVALAPATSTNAKYVYASATYTETPAVGGTAYYFGKHAVTAKFTPAGSFAKSAAAAAFTVAKPNYTRLSDGVEVATIAAGSGAAITTGETASVLYTGYLFKNGKIFDDSSRDGGTPFTFTIGGGTVITGFNEGAIGMQAGESRLILIPPAQGYGATASGSIPKNSTLLFELTMESIT